MLIAIDSIKVAARIRKEIRKVDELAEDIRANGLICPIAVMPSGEGYQLLAGLRRLRAMEFNGETEIEANVISAADAEAELNIEFAENEQRESFTYSEKIDYARLIEEVERAKASERQVAGVKAFEDNLPLVRTEGHKRETRSIVGAKIGMSGAQYDRAKYVADNAKPEVIEQIDRGERTIYRTYEELRGRKKAISPDAPTQKVRPRPVDYKRLQAEYDALKAKNAEVINSEADNRREMLETKLHNTNLQWGCEREGRNSRIAELTAALDTANARITELEAELAAAQARIIELENK